MNAVVCGKKKIDVYQFDMDKVDCGYLLEVSNLVTWDNVKVKLMKEELKQLAEFIKEYLENN